MIGKQVEVCKGEKILLESRTLTSTLTTLPADDPLHASVRDLTSHIADVTSLTDVIGRKLDSSIKVYKQLDQVTSLLETILNYRHFRICNILKFTRNSLVLIPYLLTYSQQCFVTTLLRHIVYMPSVFFGLMVLIKQL